MPRTARCGTSPSVRTPDATWRLGLLHAAIAIPGRTDHDEVVITTDEIAASGLDYLALGHWHGAQVAKARGVTYAYAGAPEPVALDQDKAGKVLLVTLEQRAEDQDRHGGGAGRRPDDLRAASRSTRRRSNRSPPSSPASAARPTRTASWTCG